MATLEDLKRFSVSRNYYMQLVRPLFESENFNTQTALKKLLQDDLHKAFWRQDGPLPFDNAIAGKCQEVLNVFREAIDKGKHAQLGSIAGIGGDTVTKSRPGEGGPVVTNTVQFKTVAAERIEGVHENLQKAAWQLCGLGGETPEKGSRKIIEIVLYRTHEYTAYTPERWAEEIKSALSEGYTQKGVGADGEKLFANVDVVKITTVSSRMKFKVDSSGTVTLDGAKDTVTRGFIFESGRLKQHWDWLVKTWWPKNVDTLRNKSDVIKATIKFGIGGTGAYQELPFESTSVSSASS